MDNVIRIVIVDDHEAVRDGLSALVSNEPDMEVSAEASNGQDALERVRAVRPTVVLMDVSMPGWSGMTTTRRVLEVCPGTKIIALSRYDDPSVVRGMLDAGAVGYVLKQNASGDLIHAIRAVAAGKMILPSEKPRTPQPVAHDQSSESREEDPGDSLSDTEQRVLLLVAKACSNEQIARSLSMSADDTAAIKNQAMRKAGLVSRIQVVGYAQRRGWID
jgi:DNA-binding NarL/FixJ family response regulator